MTHIIKVFKSGTTLDVTYVQVGTSWHKLQDGQTTQCEAPEPAFSVEVGTTFYEFLGSGVAAPTKFLPSTIFAINVSAIPGAPVIEIHERKAHGIAPLFGAPRRTLHSISLPPVSLAIPLTRRFSDTEMVPGAQLTSNDPDSGTMTVVSTNTDSAYVTIPGLDIPHLLHVRQFSASFLKAPSVEYASQAWTRKTPELAPLPQGNCEVLIPGAVTNLGLVVRTTESAVGIETPGGEIFSYLVFFDPAVSSRMFIDRQEPPVVITPAVPLPPMQVGELWASHTGEYLTCRVPGYVSPITDEVLRGFWGDNTLQDLRVPTPTEFNGASYPCAHSAQGLPKIRLNHAGHWAVVRHDDDATRADIESYGQFHLTHDFHGLPVAAEEFQDPQGNSTNIPYPAILANSFTCGLCCQENQDTHTSRAAHCYHDAAVAERQTIDVGGCCQRSGRVTRCPECSVWFSVDIDNRPERYRAYCPRCTLAGRVTMYHGYSYKPAPKFFGTGPLFFGVELELKAPSTTNMRSMADRVATSPSGPLVYAKTDSSIGEYGLEFVTHPFSLEHIQANPQLLGGLMNLVSSDDEWLAASSCGIHIHTSKKGYSALRGSIPGAGADKLTDEQLLTRGIFRAQKFVYGNPKLIKHFAGRDSSRYASLAIAPGNDNHGDRVTGAREALRLCRDHDSSKSLRYSAMNFTKDTIEYRVFKSTTDYNELLRNILFIDSIVQYARHHAMPKTKAPDLAPYRKFLDTQDYYAPVRDHFDAWTGAKKAKPVTAPMTTQPPWAPSPTMVWTAHPTPPTPEAQAILDYMDRLTRTTCTAR